MNKLPPQQPSVGFEVYELSRAMRRYFDRRARALGATQEQWRALWNLERSEGITQAGLAEILEIQPISLSRTLDRMEASGLIERRPDPQDRRALQLFLTSQAAPILKTMRREVEAFRALAGEGMSAAEQSAVVNLLGRMRANINKQENAGGERLAQGQ